jgi:hypothetical protein
LALRLAGHLKTVSPQPLLIENTLLKLRIKARRCLPSPNHSPDLQNADVGLSGCVCKAPHVGSMGWQSVVKLKGGLIYFLIELPII